MLLIPAIDLKDGKCVRLRQGTCPMRPSSRRIRGDGPALVAQGARRLHIVDLNGAARGGRSTRR